jgi:outer membrane lipoprotein SlyB
MPKKCGMKLFILIFMIVANFTFVNAATVRFYDDSLNLVKTGNYETGSIVDFTQIKGDFDDITFWYTAEGSIPLDNYTVTGDINLYLVPQVKEILSEYSLKDIREAISGRYMLMSDIKLTEAWIPIGNNKKPFTGIFNGGGHTISGLWTDNTSTDFIGLFGQTYGAIIKNVKVSIDAEKGLSGRNHIGAIVGSAVNTTIINSHSEGFIKGGIIVGGIVGASIHTTIERSSSTSNIEAYACAGGVVGLSIYSNLKRVSSLGTIILRGDSVNLADIYQEGLQYNIFLDYERYIDTFVWKN